MLPRISYEDRLKGCDKPILKKLFKIIIEKKTNLCVAANFKTIDEVLEFVELCGKHICILKMQHERLRGYSEDHLKLLYEKKRQHNFLLFEDRKFFDDQDTVYHMYKESYVKYVDLVTVLAAPCNFEAIKKAIADTELPDDEPRAYIAVCEVSFDKSFIDTDKSLKCVDENSLVCAGIVSQTLNIADHYNMIKASPGIHLNLSNDGGSQNWNHPSKVIEKGADVLIVGRGITKSPRKLRQSTERFVTSLILKTLPIKLIKAFRDNYIQDKFINVYLLRRRQ